MQMAISKHEKVSEALTRIPIDADIVFSNTKRLASLTIPLDEFELLKWQYAIVILQVQNAVAEICRKVCRL